MTEKLIVTQGDLIIPAHKQSVVVVRTPEEFAQAMREVGPGFGKVLKPHHQDPFLIRKTVHKR